MYEFESRVRYSEVDSDSRLTFLGVLNYLQDCSTFQSEDMGVGIDYYREQHKAWVVNYWQVDLYEMPKLGTDITIGTIPYSIKGYLGYRNFYIKDRKTGKHYAMANSIWTLIDTDTIRPVRAGEDMLKAYELSEKLPMEYVDRKRVTDMEGAVLKDPVPVLKHHLDTNHHVNNAQYVEIALDYVPEGFNIRRMQAEYIKSAVLGDIMYPMVKASAGEVFVALNDEKGKAYARVTFS